MRRGLPHDVTNALAAAAAVLEAGLAEEGSVADALSSFNGPPHRLESIGSWNGVDWYNDSKATTPHAAAVAIAAFDNIVLIAGGKDKRVDLSEMAVDAGRVEADYRDGLLTVVVPKAEEAKPRRIEVKASS